MALIADDANLSQEGKLNVLGAFDRIAAATYPTMHPKMVFVMRVEAGHGDGGRRVPIRVQLVDDTGGVLFEAGGELQAPDVRPGDVATSYQIFPLVGVVFERPGLYHFVATLGENPPHRTPLVLVKLGWGEGSGIGN